MSKSTHAQVGLTTTLTLSALCFKFLCVVDLERLKPYTSISEFQAKIWHEAGS